MRPTGRHINVVFESIEQKKQPIMIERDCVLAEKAKVEFQLRSLDEQLLTLDGLKNVMSLPNGFSEPSLNWFTCVVQFLRGPADVLRNKVLTKSDNELHRLSKDLLHESLDADTGSSMCKEVADIILQTVEKDHLTVMIDPVQLCFAWMRTLLESNSPADSQALWPVFGTKQLYGLRCKTCNVSKEACRSGAFWVEFHHNCRPHAGPRKKKRFIFPKDVLHQQVLRAHRDEGLLSETLNFNSLESPIKFDCPEQCDLLLDHYNVESVQDLLLIRIPKITDPLIVMYDCYNRRGNNFVF